MNNRHVHFSVSELSLQTRPIYGKYENPISRAAVYRSKKDEGNSQDVLDDSGLEVVDFSPTIRVTKSECRLDPTPEKSKRHITSDANL